MTTAAQLRAGRHLVSLSQVDIAELTGLSLPTIKRAESDRDVPVSGDAVVAIRAALEAAGVEFTNGRQPGVRFKGGASMNKTAREFDPAHWLNLLKRAGGKLRRESASRQLLPGKNEVETPETRAIWDEIKNNPNNWNAVWEYLIETRGAPSAFE